MSTVRSMARRRSSRPISSAPSCCCKRRSTIGGRCRHRATLSLPSHLDRRGVRLARRRRAVSTRTPPTRRNSPYSASKASSDHLVRAWHHTYGLPVAGHQLLEQLRSLSFSRKAHPADDHQRRSRASRCRSTATASNIRDWLYVEDHARALLLVVERGRIGETYCIGGRSERTNLDVVRAICALLDELAPEQDDRPARSADQFRRRPARP